MSLRDKIKAADRPLVPFAVPAWGVTVYLRPFSLADRLQLADKFDSLSPVDRVSLLVVRASHDADGVRLFADDEVGTIADMDGEALAGIAAKVREINKLETTTKEAADEKKD